MGKTFVARNYCDNLNFSWRCSISKKLSLVAPNSYRNGKNVCSEKLLRRCKLFEAILYFDKTYFRGVTQLLNHEKKCGAKLL